MVMGKAVRWMKFIIWEEEPLMGLEKCPREQSHISI
jgi:hypothetical protein